MQIIPGTAAHVRAEINDRSEFARLLKALVPENWPPESARDAMPSFLDWLDAAPQNVGWYCWYALGCDLGDERVLLGGGGFLGPPQNGCVMMGYSVLPQFQRMGYATEMAAGLMSWAVDHPDVTHIIAETEWENPASVSVLKKLGFENVGSGSEPGSTRFQFSNNMGSRPVF
jgi:RimJ/RimL family protein N-acetyltransferase